MDPRPPDPSQPPKTSLERRSRVPVIVAVAAIAVLVALAAWQLWPRGEAPPPVAPAPAPETAAAPPAVEPDVPVTVEPDQVRSALEPVSSDPRVRSWLGQPDLVRRAAVVIDNLGEGVSPREELGFLAPKGAFAVEERGGRQVIAPASYARYDGFADAIATLDAQALARAYATLRPALQTAYRALGYPQASIDTALSRALGRVVAAPVREGAVEVVPDGAMFVHADPALEGLRDVEKHLLRMGPRNTKLVQAKARELLGALGLEAAAGAPR